MSLASSPTLFCEKMVFRIVPLPLNPPPLLLAMVLLTMVQFFPEIVQPEAVFLVKVLLVMEKEE